MRSVRSLFAFLLLASFLGSVCLAQTAPAEKQHVQNDAVTEHYRLEYVLDGKKVITLIDIFPESPLENPKLVQQIREANLDHVVFMGEQDAQSRDPSAFDQLDELKNQIESSTSTPVVQVKPEKGFFNRLATAWKLSFNDSSRRPGPADYRYGLVSTVGESATFAAMVFTSADISIYNAIGLVVAQTTLAYANNVWNNSINHFLSSSLKHVGSQVSNATYFFRNMAYEYITSQVFKVIQSPSDFLSQSTQMGVLMNTVLVGSGDVLINTAAYKAFRGDKVKLAKVNFYMNAVSGFVGSLDLMQHHLMPVLTSIAGYEFRLSGAILIGYYIGVYAWIKLAPQNFLKAIDQLENGFKKIGNWFKTAAHTCSHLLSGEAHESESHP